MNNLKAGFGRANINPMMGIHVRGYYQERLADGILDDLEVNVLAVEAGGKKVALVCLDNCGINKKITERMLLKKQVCPQTLFSLHQHILTQVLTWHCRI